MPGKIVLTLAAVLLAMSTFGLADGREITAETRVTQWGQMPERFVIRGQVLPEGVAPTDFTISGMAAGWGTVSQHPFSCGVQALETTEDGWALVPERFPDKYFFVRSMTVACETCPELSFTLEDISRTLTPVADRFSHVEEHESRLSAHVFTPEGDGPRPVVLVFHGYGDTDNLLTYRTAIAWAEPENQAVRPCIVVAPTIIETFYGSEIARSRIYAGIMDYLDRLIASGQADPNRLYVMGNSFGGMASFEIAEQYPDRFAAILALCPALNYSARGMAGLSSLTDIPVCIAQAERDETIPSDVGRAAAKALADAGNPHVELRIYSDAEMNACGAAYGREETYSFHHVELAVMEDAAYAEWLFSQSRAH